MPFSLPGMTADGPEPPAPHETEERLAEPADQAGTAPSGDPADYVAEGMGHLDQAIAAFSAGCESGDSGIVPLAIELLARTTTPRWSGSAVWRTPTRRSAPPSAPGCAAPSAVTRCQPTRTATRPPGGRTSSSRPSSTAPCRCWPTRSSAPWTRCTPWPPSRWPRAVAGPATCARSCSARSACPASTPGARSCTQVSTPGCARQWAPRPTSCPPTGRTSNHALTRPGDGCVLRAMTNTAVVPVITFPVTSAFDLPGMRVERSLGVTFGLVVRSMGFSKAVTGGISSLRQGEVSQFTVVLEDARRHALDRMIENAKLLGANAVIAVRFDSSEIGKARAEVVAYGTAVVAVPSA